jgi:hypothetical protein
MVQTVFIPYFPCRMATNGRIPVKRRVLTRQETLQRLRDECSDRISKDKEAYRESLRGVIRDSMPSDGIDEVDIDKLIEEFLAGMDDDIPIAEDPGPIDDDDSWKPGMVKCPICVSGWLLEPYPGLVTCDACPEMTLAIGLADLASLLDGAIRNHSLGCTNSNLQFSVSNKVLYSACSRCGLRGPLVQ